MKILFLLQSFPFPPCDGISWKVFNLLKYFSAKGWECDILAFGAPGPKSKFLELEAQLPGVRVLGVAQPAGGLTLLFRKIWALFRGYPPSLGEFKSSEFKAALIKAASSGKYDLVHYDVINMAQYLGWGPKVPSVFSSNDAVSLLYERNLKEAHGKIRKLYLALAAKLIRRFENEIYPQFDRVHVVSAEDRNHLKSGSPEMPVEIIPIGVDNSFTEYKPAVMNEKIKGRQRVVFVGNLDIPGIYNGLFEFLETAYPFPGAVEDKFDFYVLAQKAGEAEENRLAGFKGVKYFPWVEDYKAFLAGADIILVLDKSGTGIKTRVLEAMAMGKPVIGTTIAFGGISAQDGKHCLIRNTSREIYDALILLLDDEELGEKMGRAAKELVQTEYVMGVVGPKWEAMYLKVAGK